MPTHDLPYLQHFDVSVTQFDIVTTDGTLLLGPVPAAVASRQLGNIRDVTVREHVGAL